MPTPQELQQQQNMLQLLGSGTANQAGGQLANRGSQIDAIVDAMVQGQQPGQPPQGMPAPPPDMAQNPALSGAPGYGAVPQASGGGAVLSTIMQKLKGLSGYGQPPR